jgi:hypothetical protein
VEVEGDSKQPGHNVEAEGDSINQSIMISEILWENCSYVEAEGDSINQSIMRRQHQPEHNVL